MLNPSGRKVWTEGNPPGYRFCEGDTLETRDARHLIQVVATDSPDLAWRLYRRTINPGNWEPVGLYTTTAQDFVTLLRTGEIGGVINVPSKA